MIKQFVKALDKEGDCFNYICRKFPKLSMEKLKSGIFNGPQIRQLMKDTDFIKVMTVSENKAWKSFVLVVENFLGNHEAPNYEEIVQNVLTNFQTLGANISSYTISAIIWINFRITQKIIVRNRESGSTRI